MPQRQSHHLLCTLIIGIIIISCITIVAVRATMSGFYVDNGRDQTVRLRTLTPSDLERAKRQILKVLGLRKPPAGRKLRIPSMRMSAPKFLLDMYRRLGDHERSGGGHRRRPRRGALLHHEHHITAIDRLAFEQSDMIMTFLSKRECFLCV